VYKATDETNHKTVILKMYHKKRMQPKHFSKLEREIHVMAAMRGPCITELLGSYEDQTEICLVMEYCEGGDLFKAMMLRGGVLEEKYVGAEVRSSMQHNASFLDK
jgi:serine/threonine protein kinase